MKYHPDISKNDRTTKFIVTIRFLFLLLSMILSSKILMGAPVPADEKGEASLVYVEIPVRVMVDGYKTFYLDAIYTSKKILFIDVADLFSKLNIPCLKGHNGNSLAGFIEKESRAYLIDYEKRIIKVDSKVFPSTTGLVKDKETLYMESTLITEAFGISLTFSHHALSIILKSNFELPVLKQQRIEKMRNNLMKLKGEVTADTTVQRNYHLMKFGTLDWAFASTQTNNSETNNHFSVGIGTELLYGEADVLINYYDQQKFDNRQLFYQWRWVDNNKKFIKQAQLGTLSAQTIAFINAPLVGATIRNTPTTVRKASGYYNISEYTEPNWSVELYINNTLVDFTRSDASGLYVFKVPIVYGYSTLKLKFYGPMGEERTVERTMNMPYTVMPAKEFEYGLSAGMVEDSLPSRFGRGDFNYGVSRFLTVGGGVEYLSSISNGAYIPFLTLTFQPFSKLTLNAEYDQGVKTKGLLNYYFGKDILLELEYTKYKEGQLACIMNAPEERKARISIPFGHKIINGYVKLDWTQLVYKRFKYNQTGVLFSAYYKQFNVNSSTQFNWMDQRNPYVISDLALSYRLGNGYTLRPSAQYNVNSNSFSTYRVALEKYIRFGNVSLSCERNVPSNTTLFNVNLKYDLSFARTNLSTTRRKHKITNEETPQKGNTVISESAEGSLAFGRGNKYVYKSNNSSVGKGGISFYPFLDLNGNGKRDKDEPMVKLSRVSISGTKTILKEKDSILSIPDLMAFTYFTAEFKDTDLENISWRFEKHIYRIMIDPNQFKKIDVPIVPVGEVEGMAYLNTDNSLKGIGRIQVKFYNKNTNEKIGETLSESDGYIRFMGFEPGEYVARIDSTQMSNLNYTALPEHKDFTIRISKEGDIVNGLDFILNPSSELAMLPDNKIDSLPQPAETDTAIVIKDSLLALIADTLYKVHLLVSFSPVKVKDKTTGDFPVKEIETFLNVQPVPRQPFRFFNHNLVMNTKDTMIYLPGTILYEVHLCAYSKPVTGKEYFIPLLTVLPGIRIIESMDKNGLYHYSTGAFLFADEALEYLRFLKELGWKNGFVAIFNGGKCKVISFTPEHSQ